MDFELWFLVIAPLMFAAGWWMRGLDTRQRRQETHGLDRHYFQGLSLLLSDEPDKAIDRFIEVVRLEPETIELHHVLGNLFRRRGQFDRAIRLHNYIANRAELSDKERTLALSELALDFLKAGMYDRAEQTYQTLSKIPESRAEALEALMRIYCTEREWTKAIEVAEQLEREVGRDLHGDITHYYCELAARARKSNDLARAREFVGKAMRINPNSVRAMALSADLALDENNHEEALRHWNDIQRKSPQYLPLIAQKKGDVLADENPEKAVAFLKEVFAQTGSIDVLDAAVKRLIVHKGKADACAFATEALQRSRSLSAFAVMCQVRQQLNPEDQQTAVLADMTARQAKKLARYQCVHCGFLAHTFAWQCPGCEHWDAFPPLRVEESKKSGGGY